MKLEVYMMNNNSMLDVVIKTVFYEDEEAMYIWNELGPRTRKTLISLLKATINHFEELDEDD